MRLCPVLSRGLAGRLAPPAGPRFAGRLGGLLLACVLGGAGAAGAGDLPPVPPVPSGLGIALQGVLLDVKPDGMHTYARYRFVAPGIVGARAPDFETRMEDMQFLCDRYALPLERAGGAGADRIVISLSDRETEFGAAAPEATQFFEAFSLGEEACIWEEF